MKIESVITFMVIIAGLFFVFALMIEESNTQLPDAGLNSSEWETQYDYVDNINESISPLKEKLDVITQEDTGWFKKITTGITAIPKVIVFVPKVTFDTLKFGGNMITDFFVALNFPGKVTIIALTIVFIFAIFKLISFIGNRRSP